MVNIALPTLGGKQFWADLRVVGGWRIQRHVETGHHRLLDERDIRRAWGSREHCDEALAEAQAEGKAKNQSDRLCLMVHGHIRAKESFNTMAAAMREDGYDAYAINYPSARATVDDLLEQMRTLMADFWHAYSHIDIVTHSMGGLLMRAAITDKEWDSIGRFVMLGPPNQGAFMADQLSGHSLSRGLYRLIYGPSGQALITGPDGLAAKAGIPGCEFGIIAGGRGAERGYSPLIPGDNDGVVEVTSTKLDGMTDHLVLPVLHTTMMADDEVIRQTKYFLAHGRFERT